MKKFKILTPILAVATLSSSVMPLTGCNKKPEVVEHTITFKCSEGMSLEGETSFVFKDKIKWKDVTKPKPYSTVADYQLLGWYNGINQLTDETEITSDITAKFIGYDPAQVLTSITVKTAFETYEDNTFIQGGTWGQFKDYYGIVEDPVKEGWIFSGWYVNDKQISDDFVFEVGLISTTVEAKFIENNKVIKFEASEGVTLSSYQQITVKPGILWKNVNKPDADFNEAQYLDVGWYNTDGMVKLEDETPITEDTTAKYVVLDRSFDVITVTLEIDNHTYSFSFEANNYWKKFKEVYGIQTPTKKGHTFEGWYYEGEKIDEENFRFPSGPKSFTLTAKFNVNKQTIQFQTDEGATFESGPTEVQVDYGTLWKDIEKPIAELKPDYMENGWYDQHGHKFKDDTFIKEDVVMTYRTINIAETKVSVWFKIGSTTLGPLTFLQGKTWGQFKGLYEIEDPEVEGYYFDGWTYEGNKISDNWVFPVGINDVEITAKLDASFTIDSWENIYECISQSEPLAKLHNRYRRDCDKNKDFPGTLIGLIRKVKINGVEHRVRVIGENQDTVTETGQKASLTFESVDLLSAPSKNALCAYWTADVNCNYVDDTQSLRRNLNVDNGAKWYNYDTWGPIFADHRSLYQFMTDAESGTPILAKMIKPTKHYVTTVKYTGDKSWQEQKSLVKDHEYSDKIFVPNYFNVTKVKHSYAWESPDKSPRYTYYAVTEDRGTEVQEARIKADLNGVRRYYFLGSPECQLVGGTWGVYPDGRLVPLACDRSRAVDFAFAI